jgi:hypothetical protein
MAKTAQILSNLNENLFDFFDFAVKKFCGSSLVVGGGEVFGSITALGSFTLCQRVSHTFGLLFEYLLL